MPEKASKRGAAMMNKRLTLAVVGPVEADGPAVGLGLGDGPSEKGQFAPGARTLVSRL